MMLSRNRRTSHTLILVFEWVLHKERRESLSNERWQSKYET